MQYDYAQIIVQSLVDQGICFAVFGSGYRLTPLLLAIQRHPSIELFHHIDERGATYRALGWAKATGKPALVLTTSGTATVNAFPALVEASLDRIPLLLFSSDRPSEMQNSGNNQTIDQHRLFHRYVRYFDNIACDSKTLSLDYLRGVVSQSVRLSLYPLAGPVHVNCFWREPLEFGIDNKNSLLSQRPSKPSCQNIFLKKQSVLLENDLINIFKEHSWGMICVGSGLSVEEGEMILKLAEYLGWAIFPDILSGLRLHRDHENIIFHYTSFLTKNSHSTLPSVDRVLFFGRRFVSKELHRWLSEQNLKYYISVTDDSHRHDTNNQSTHFVVASPMDYCVALLDSLKQKNKFEELKHLKREDRKRETFLCEGRGSDNSFEMDLYRCLIHDLNDQSVLFLSNSSPVRFLDEFAPKVSRTIVVSANRGVSGIDGILSTTLGFCQGSQKPLTAVIGDLAFLYDMNALTFLKQSVFPICLVIINNNGGGIFKNLPISRVITPTEFEVLYQTPHDCHFDRICATFDLPYFFVSSLSQFEAEYRECQQIQKHVVIEVQLS